MYFLRKLWVEFVLGLKPSYFDIRSFQGVGGGMPQDRPGEKMSDNTRNHIRPQPLVPLPTPVVPTPHYHQVVSSSLASLSDILRNLVEKWMQGSDICPLRHIFTSFGDICRGPQSDVDGAHGDHYAKGADFDDDAYSSHGDGSDDIDVLSFVDLLQGEPRDSQEQQLKF